ncbi:MAG: hypothetical protein HZB18_07535 [Chloroflexi bacterium]|nr:hypothetical protein [Chloroflexota bacterium]
MRARIIYVLLVFSLIVTSCAPQLNIQEPSVIDWDDLQIAPKTNDDLCAEISPKELNDWENIKKDFTYGLALGFLPEDVLNPHKIAHETYWVNTNEQLLFDWLFWYPEGNEGPANLRLFVLLDERQLNNALPQSGVYNDIDLEKGDDKSIKVAIPPLSAGIHDVIVVGIPYPQSDPDEYGRAILVYRRITLIAEPASSPFRKIDFISLPVEGSMKKNDPRMSLELTLKESGIDVWNWPNPWLDIDPGTPTHFFALAGYEDVTNLDAPPMDQLETAFFSLLLFTDYQQVEIKPNQMAIYGKVNKDTAYARIPITINPLSEGKHPMLVLRIDSPGVPMCILKGNPKERILPNSIYGKLVGINVLPQK